MNVADMQVAVKLGLDKTSSLELPSFEPEELNYWLTVGQEKYIKQVMQSSEEDIINNLYPIVKRVSFTGSAYVIRDNYYTTGQYAYYLDLAHLNLLSYPDKFMYYFKGRAKVTRTEGESTYTASWTPVDFINVTELDKYLETGHNVPYFENPVCFLQGDRLYYICDSYTSISTVELIYIQYPRKLIYTVPSAFLSSIVSAGDEYATLSDLPEHTHQDIVNVTVNLLLENIESQRFQTQSMLTYSQPTKQK
jgi:hypothetical protein